MNIVLSDDDTYGRPRGTDKVIAGPDSKKIFA